MVHPRVCGEHCSGTRMTVTRFGSSPRVRGTHFPRASACASNRFIPACAGNTRTVSSRSRKTEVHPRVCGEHGGHAGALRREAGSSPRVGEHALRYIEDSDPGGSSPRVRGTPPGYPIGILAFRFIPACAGNTVPSAWQLWSRMVHPRVCGEHFPVRVWPPRARGSSPRVRGTPRAGARQ